ncbi:MAG: hypothetical protein K5864_02280 [Bacteroidales bacterium]|nr:hypothetical protein [Bacteroidales bacterium]
MENQIRQPKINEGTTQLNPNLPTSVNKKIIDSNLESQKISKEEKKESRGLLGRVWGAREHSSNNIAGLLIFLLVFIATGYTVFMLFHEPVSTHGQVIDFWGIITPLITLALGYIFGKNNKD